MNGYSLQQVLRQKFGLVFVFNFKTFNVNFNVESIKIESAPFPYKLPYQKPMLRRREWWAQNGPIIIMCTQYTSLFSLVKKSELSQNNLNFNLKKRNEWTHQWKMLFNPDPRKQATEVYYSRKLNQDSPLPFDFNDNAVQTVEVHNHLGLS